MFIDVICQDLDVVASCPTKERMKSIKAMKPLKSKSIPEAPLMAIVWVFFDYTKSIISIFALFIA